MSEPLTDPLKALRFALDHVVELREAWQRGALSEREGKGGSRSNRNVEVEHALRQAIDRLDQIAGAPCGIVGEPPLGPKDRYVCTLPKGHKGHHRDGRVTWIGYHVTEDQIAGATPAKEPVTFDADEVRRTFQGTSIDTQRMRIVTGSLSRFCADHLCIYHTGGDNSVDDMLLTNGEGRYLLEVLTEIYGQIAGATPVAVPTCQHGHIVKTSGCVSCELLWQHSEIAGATEPDFPNTFTPAAEAGAGPAPPAPESGRIIVDWCATHMAAMHACPDCRFPDEGTRFGVKPAEAAPRDPLRALVEKWRKVGDMLTAGDPAFWDGYRSARKACAAELEEALR